MKLVRSERNLHRVAPEGNDHSGCELNTQGVFRREHELQEGVVPRLAGEDAVETHLLEPAGERGGFREVAHVQPAVDAHGLR